MTTTNEILRFRITLAETNVWREVLVPSTLTMARLHNVIQGAMGWHDTHPHEFVHGHDKVSGKALVANQFARKRSRLLYVYDFGDYWEHDVVLMERLPAGGSAVPVCSAGQMACPPEDCGGLPGYQTLLDLQQRKRLTAEQKELRAWAGDWEPNSFDKKAANQRLAQAFNGATAKVQARRPAAVVSDSYTTKQGQYLSFIFWYTRLNRQPPAEADIQRFFGVTAPAVHQMVDTLDRLKLIHRVRGKARTIQVLVLETKLPRLEEPSTPMQPVKPHGPYTRR